MRRRDVTATYAHTLLRSARYRHAARPARAVDDFFGHVSGLPSSWAEPLRLLRQLATSRERLVDALGQSITRALPRPPRRLSAFAIRVELAQLHLPTGWVEL